jgi:hypothetical protein
MRYTYLVVLMFFVVGCAPDPMRDAVAHERRQQADTDTRNAQAMLLALQSQQAIVQGQTAQAQALAQVEIAKTIAEAARPNYMPLYAAMFALVLIVIVWLLVNGRKPVAASPRLLFRSQHAEAWLLVDGTIHLRRLSDGQARIYLPSDDLYAKLLTGGK